MDWLETIHADVTYKALLHLYYSAPRYNERHRTHQAGVGKRVIGSSGELYGEIFSILCMSEVIFLAYFMVNAVLKCAWSV